MKSSLTERQQKKAVAAFTAQAIAEMVPLFVPLYTRFYEAFATGKKTIEYRSYGPGWNERTCLVGRRVTLSKGYGKCSRLSAVITKFEKVGPEARIHLDVDCLGKKITEAALLRTSRASRLASEIVGGSRASRTTTGRA